MKNIHKLVLAAMFLAIGHILPFLTGQIPQIGKMLLPMHIPVLLCGFICGWQYGLVVGFVLPLMRSMIWGMPLMFPTAVCMAFELAAYGTVSGLLYGRVRRRNVAAIYGCLLTAMICGRIVAGIAKIFCLGVGADGFTLQAFYAGSFLNAIPGIVLQLVVIPAILVALSRRENVADLAEVKE